MRKLYLLPLTAAVAFATTTWKPLFNGKTFEPDWKIVGDKNYWRIDPTDSSIAGESETNTPATMVFSKIAYDQFTVKYSYRLKAGCSGFFFRAKEVAASPYVNGCQVEAKFEAGGLKEFGSLYCHPSPGWVRETDPKFPAYASRPVDQYQDVILTVKNPNVYVNINGKQAIGASTAGQAAGGKAEWNYTTNVLAQAPGLFGLQIHELQPKMNVHFKNIMILTGCSDKTSPKYDGAFVAGMPEQPAIYEDNGTCVTTSLAEAEQMKFLRNIGTPERVGNEVSLKISYPGSHTLEIISLKGKVVFSGSSPSAFEYHISTLKNPGLYVARIKTENRVASTRILVP